MKRDFQKSKGFTLIEMLVVMGAFAIITVPMVSFVVYAIRMQRYSLAYERLLDQTSYAMEYMNRMMRNAKGYDYSDSPADCGSFQAGQSFDATSNAGTIKFFKLVNNVKVCQWFRFDSSTGMIYSKTAGGTDLALFSDTIKVTNFSVNVTGDDNSGDNYQPKVTISLKAEARNISPVPKVFLQTTVTVRDLDI